MKFVSRIVTGLFGLAAMSLISACDRSTPPANPPQPGRASPAAAATKPSGTNLDTVGYVRGETTPAAAPALPAGHPPLDASARRPAAPASPAGGGELELQYTAPASWTSQPPANPMRIAQFALPRAEGDQEDGLLTVSRVGGPIEMNIARWRNMFKAADGQPLPETAMKSESFEANGLKVTVVDITGRYADAMTRGTGATTSVDFRLLGGVVEHPAGNWYFKATGPAPTMQQQHEAFMTFVRSVRPK